MKRFAIYVVAIAILVSSIPICAYGMDYSPYIGVWRGTGNDARFGVDILSTDGNTMNFRIIISLAEYDVNSAVIQGNKVSGRFHFEEYWEETGLLVADGYGNLTLNGPEITLEMAFDDQPDNVMTFVLKQMDYSSFIGEWYDINNTAGVTIERVTNTEMDFVLRIGRFGITECKNATVDGTKVTYNHTYITYGVTYTDTTTLLLSPNGIEMIHTTDILGNTFYSPTNPDFVYKTNENIPIPVMEKVTVVLNGNKLEFDQEPITESDRILVPLRKIFESLGATVDWNNDTQTVTAVKDYKILNLTVDDNILYINDTPLKLDVPACARNGRILVPVRAITESFDCDVQWDDNSKTVIITEKK